MQLPVEAQRNCGHASEPFALASGTYRIPFGLATPGPKPNAIAFSSLGPSGRIGIESSFAYAAEVGV